MNRTAAKRNTRLRDETARFNARVDPRPACACETGRRGVRVYDDTTPQTNCTAAVLSVAVDDAKYFTCYQLNSSID